jgi:hypothetical protein
MIYTKDENNKNVLYDENYDYQTMMEWEKPYMEALIDMLSPSGDVLEIGFGLGYSATQIQKHKINSHTIIENNPEVLKVAKEWAKLQPNKVIIIEGNWQDCLNSLGKFDSFFFDDAPTKEYKDLLDIRVYDFFYRVLKKHANVNSKMSWYCCKELYWMANSFINWSNKSFQIEIPNNCNYIDKITKEKKTMYMPLIIFSYGIVEEIVPLAIDKDFNVINIYGV